VRAGRPAVTTRPAGTVRLVRVHAAFIESYGQLPEQMYLGFDAKHPVRSGSIGSVYVAKHFDEPEATKTARIGTRAHRRFLDLVLEQRHDEAAELWERDLKVNLSGAFNCS